MVDRHKPLLQFMCGAHTLCILLVIPPASLSCASPSCHGVEKFPHERNVYQGTEDNFHCVFMSRHCESSTRAVGDVTAVMDYFVPLVDEDCHWFTWEWIPSSPPPHHPAPNKHRGGVIRVLEMETYAGDWLKFAVD